MQLSLISKRKRIITGKHVGIKYKYFNMFWKTHLTVMILLVEYFTTYTCVKMLY